MNAELDFTVWTHRDQFSEKLHEEKNKKPQKGLDGFWEVVLRLNVEGKGIKNLIGYKVGFVCF